MGLVPKGTKVVGLGSLASGKMCGLLSEGRKRKEGSVAVGALMAPPFVPGKCARGRKGRQEGAL